MQSFCAYNSQSVALAIIGYYPDWYEGRVKDLTDTGKIRGDLALEFVHKANNDGYHIVFVDGGSSQEFLSQIRSIPEIVFEEMHAVVIKRSPKKQRAYLLASKIPEVKVIVSVEAEKVSFLDSISKIVVPLVTNQAQIVVPKRDEVLFKSSYPDFQYISESQANKDYNRILREHNLLLQNQEDLDILFGPIAFQNTPKLLQLFQQRVKFRKYEDGKFPSEFHDPDQYSNAYFFPTVLALKHGMKVTSITIPFQYPSIQKENEERLSEKFIEKRKLQKDGIVSNLNDFLAFEKKTME